MRRLTVLSKPVAPAPATQPLREFLCEGRHYRVVQASYTGPDHNAVHVWFMHLNEYIRTDTWYYLSTGKIGNPGYKINGIAPPRYIDPQQIKDIIEWDFR